jgi:carbon storage regulator
MLVLTRKESEKIQIGDNIFITVVKIVGDKVRIGIEAPVSVPVDRSEVADKKRLGIAQSSYDYKDRTSHDAVNALPPSRY